MISRRRWIFPIRPRTPRPESPLKSFFEAVEKPSLERAKRRFGDKLFVSSVA
jgi:hypothetical protein